MFSSKNYLNLQSPSVKAWVEMLAPKCPSVGSSSPSVKAWVEMSSTTSVPSSRQVAFREGVSWNTPNSLQIRETTVAFREGVSWNSQMAALRPGCRLSPSVKAWVEMGKGASTNENWQVAFREGVSWNTLQELQCLALRVAFREGVSWNIPAISPGVDGSVAFREGVSWEY